MKPQGQNKSRIKFRIEEAKGEMRSILYRANRRQDGQLTKKQWDRIEVLRGFIKELEARNGE